MLVVSASGEPHRLSPCSLIDMQGMCRMTSANAVCARLVRFLAYARDSLRGFGAQIG
jgi:hypothetical protein